MLDNLSLYYQNPLLYYELISNSRHLINTLDPLRKLEIFLLDPEHIREIPDSWDFLRLYSTFRKFVRNSLNFWKLSQDSLEWIIINNVFLRTNSELLKVVRKKRNLTVLLALFEPIRTLFKSKVQLRNILILITDSPKRVIVRQRIPELDYIFTKYPGLRWILEESSRALYPPSRLTPDDLRNLPGIAEELIRSSGQKLNSVALTQMGIWSLSDLDLIIFSKFNSYLNDQIRKQLVFRNSSVIGWFPHLDADNTKVPEFKIATRRVQSGHQIPGNWAGIHMTFLRFMKEIEEEDIFQLYELRRVPNGLKGIAKKPWGLRSDPWEFACNPDEMIYFLQQFTLYRRIISSWNDLELYLATQEIFWFHGNSPGIWEISGDFQGRGEREVEKFGEFDIIFRYQ
jgi:hypothetical protein